MTYRPELSTVLMRYNKGDARVLRAGRARLSGMVRRAKAPPPPRPPADTAAGAVLVRQFVVRLFDRQDGEGVNWQMIGETLFKAAFDVLDRLPEDQRQALARRVHAGAYDRAAGNGEGERGEGKSPAVEPPKAKPEKAPRPHAPR